MADLHAKTCSPSAAEGWFACAGRPVMEAAFPDDENQYSADGSARHEVCATVLLDQCAGKQVSVADFVGRAIPLDGKRITYLPEWVEEDQDYVDVVRSLAQGGELFVERQVDFSKYTGVPGDSFGTADAIVLREISVVGEDGLVDAHELIVVDRKTGYHEVPVERNKQLMLYALGAVAEFGLVYDIARVRLVIHQRKAIEWDCSIKELQEFAKTVREKAGRVRESLKAIQIMPQAAWAAEFLNPEPSEEACKYCRAMATCPSMQAKVQALVGADFTLMADPNADVENIVASPERLGEMMTATGLVEDWCKAVRAEVERRLFAGQPVPGFKLVLGKQGARKWTDDAAAEAALKGMRLKVEEMYELSLISPTTADKLANPKKGAEPVIGPRQWKKLQPFITRSDPKPSVAPASDPRSTYTPPSPADDFAPIPETQGAEAGAEFV